MKTNYKFIAPCLAFLLASSLANAASTNYTTSGNLESTSTIGCETKNKLNSKLTPADLYSALPICVKKTEYERGVFIFALAGVYAYFDGLRVADKSARQAAKVLTMLSFDSMDKEGQELFKKQINTTLSNDSNRAGICKEINSIGIPQYYPRYMVQHGMKAFQAGEQDNQGLVADFDSKLAWQQALSGYLNCPVM
ncbi:hypothetical protein [Deefgea sp. CFH1-16]|uniref:hypothetical protein n=1 Tax=Deefgea sp. CFH1-16 TaxID=2675457 RepID=UPI0015F76511|nr:hypothetical protein [Deefgea sp. CFH1-16]MBM5573689.1 hypothetical protein [Deefgea sp. CFH1-16]